MTNTNVSANKPTATIVHESPSPLRVWWMKTNVRYDIAMNSSIIILNIAAILYMKFTKIPFNEVAESWIAYVMGRICNNIGFVIFLHLLYCISTRLALFVVLHFCLPYWLWYIATSTITGLLLCELRDWWKFVNQPQSVAVDQKNRT
ncbi:transmembrane protein [Arabidopsis thaliana]|uniref:Transmembrane protein n=1 Tax=Arabidopsis thaliana TaxID=3702 RepID=F4KA31_ARATH|nr:uncharacterized protein AT5G38090 [Arabidopsis thaliana]AED94266.1 transmembrane protein [Arabidopsis thaliana]|eukprot:NP_198625.1 transmembrane protein [Arabidopsis thaliana]